ncbi:hypothetical protein CC80DRAFT_554398 [Byssothecium circinans]|uniref:Uncharacterized protein n=1 Tax=Byssothecium circinans TaxID=147558 RepID=A0A6A5TC94_9PLEO|nr:hypothetical protein CC80DRAFT_554398 [Byssothecium circinans]
MTTPSGSAPTVPVALNFLKEFDNETIVSTAERAHQLLLHYSIIPKDQTRVLEEAKKELDRFELWATTSRVFLPEPDSLDHRLRSEARADRLPRLLIINFLEIICTDMLGVFAGRELTDEEMVTSLKAPVSTIPALCLRYLEQSCSEDARLELLLRIGESMNTMEEVVKAVHKAKDPAAPSGGKSQEKGAENTL